MKNILPLILAAILLPFGSRAQVPSVREGAPFRADPSTSAWREVVENHGSSAITGLNATFHCPGRFGLIRGVDTSVDYDPLFAYTSRDVPIPPAGSVEIAAEDPSQCTGAVDAVIFADGHTEGTPQKVAELYQQRRGAYIALGEAIEKLQSISNQEATPGKVAEDMDRLSHSTNTDQNLIENERTSLDYASERIGMEYVFGVVMTALENQLIYFTPSDSTANRLPTVSDYAQKQGISKEVAHAILLTKKLQEWRAALEGNMEPAPAN